MMRNSKLPQTHSVTKPRNVSKTLTCVFPFSSRLTNCFVPDMHVLVNILVFGWSADQCVACRGQGQPYSTRLEKIAIATEQGQKDRQTDRQTDRQFYLTSEKSDIRGRRTTARSSSHPPPRNTVELLRRNTSRTAQETTNSLQISYRSTYIYKNGADISLRDKHT